MAKMADPISWCLGSEQGISTYILLHLESQGQRWKPNSQVGVSQEVSTIFVRLSVTSVLLRSCVFWVQDQDALTRTLSWCKKCRHSNKFKLKCAVGNTWRVHPENYFEIYCLFYFLPICFPLPVRSLTCNAFMWWGILDGEKLDLTVHSS